MMKDAETLARVILRSDGSVHIAFPDIRSIWATAENIMELFSDPIEFIETGSHKHKDSSFEINRNRLDLEEILGLTLASVNSDKQIVCDFPELFQYILHDYANETDKSRPLDMSQFEFETYLSDEKSFLLRYYLEFTKNIKRPLVIKKNIRLRDEIQFQIVREILNTYFEEELPKAKPKDNLAKQITDAQSSKMFAADTQIETDDFLTTDQYAKLLGISPQTVRNYIKDKRIKNVKTDSRGRYLINKNERPIDWNRRYGKTRKKHKDGDKFYKRKNEGSAADVEAHILKLNLFTAAVAPYIRTYEELKYYTERSYHEVVFNGRHCLIIDVNPDYISSKTQISNRARMEAGKPPVYPNRDKENHIFHLHHVGQSASACAPFAIIPEYDHNGRILSSIFHQGAPSTDLHGPEFEALKAAFWKTYIAEYDKARGYRNIPYLNPKHKR